MPLARDNSSRNLLPEAQTGEENPCSWWDGGGCDLCWAFRVKARGCSSRRLLPEEPAHGQLAAPAAKSAGSGVPQPQPAGPPGLPAAPATQPRPGRASEGRGDKHEGPSMAWKAPWPSPTPPSWGSGGGRKHHGAGKGLSIRQRGLPWGWQWAGGSSGRALRMCPLLSHAASAPVTLPWSLCRAPSSGLSWLGLEQAALISAPTSR